MIIGLDYDNTYTKNTEFWNRFLHLCVLSGVEVYVTTSRADDTPIEIYPEGIVDVIYCRYMAKKDVTENLGIHIDIWIDDDPFYITTGFVPTSFRK